ncbi:7960_t:CDS:2, partial [Funneliformis geosporum]
AMNSIFSSDITPETIAKLEREQSQIQEKKDELPKLEFELSKLEMYADACVKVLPIMKQEWSSYENITKEIQQKAKVARSIRIKADEAKSILESKKEELDEIKEEFDEKTEIINKIRIIK